MNPWKIRGSAFLILTTLALAATSFAQSLSSGIPDTVLPQGVGVNIHFTAGHTQDLDMIAAAGFKFIRMDCSWSSIETTKGVYNWSAYDELVSNLEQRGLRAILILDYNNPLYLNSGASKDTGPVDSTDIAAYCKWAAATVTHFEGDHIIWEIWNEPNNNSFWKPSPSAAQYATFALAACKAIRKADPDATIIGPAADRFPSDLLDSVMTSGVIDYLDAVSVHPYRGNLYPENAALYTPSSTPNDRGYDWLDSLISSYGPTGKRIPIICSEWGYSSSSVSPQTQADYLVRIQLFNLYKGIPLSVWYDWTGGNSGFNAVNAATMTPKPAYTAVTALTRELGGYGISNRVQTGNDSDVVLTLRNPGDSVKVAAWTEGESSKVKFSLSALSLPDTAHAVWWVNDDGDTGMIKVSSDGFSAELTGAPTYYSVFPPVPAVPVPNIPNPVFPVDGAAGLPRMAGFNWSRSSSYFTVEYHLQIATDLSVTPRGAFQTQNVVLDTLLADTSLQLSYPLDSGATYYWHISSVDLGGASNYSPIHFFKTGTAVSVPSPPVNVFPAFLAKGVTREPTFRWESSRYAKKYELQVATDYHVYTTGDSAGMFLDRNVVLDTIVADTSFHLTVPLDSSTTYFWQVRGSNSAGHGSFSSTGRFETGTSLTTAVNVLTRLPKNFTLSQNYPNPFNPTTRIEYAIPKREYVSLKVYNVLGQAVATLVSGVAAPGSHVTTFDGTGLASDVYFYRLQAAGMTITRELVLMK